MTSLQVFQHFTFFPYYFNSLNIYLAYYFYSLSFTLSELGYLG